MHILVAHFLLGFILPEEREGVLHRCLAEHTEWQQPSATHMDFS